jgi:hypothetical protein
MINFNSPALFFDKELNPFSLIFTEMAKQGRAN